MKIDRLFGLSNRLISLYTLLFWVIYAIYYYLLNRMTVPDISLMEVAFSVPLFALIAIGTFMILNRLMTARYWWVALIALTALYSSIILIAMHAINHISGESTMQPSHFNPVSLQDQRFLRTMITVVSNYAMFGIAGFFVHRLVIAVREKFAEMAAKKTLEYDALAGQLPPHFVANIISQWRYQLRPDQEELSKNMLSAHEIMVHHMDAHSACQRFTSLKSEIQQIHNYITLYDWQKNDNYFLMNVTGDITGYVVPPLSLFSLVENARKHGRTDLSDEPVEISITVTPGRLLFTCSNLVCETSKWTSHGQGLANLRRRMELVYGDRFGLDNFYNGARYIVRLQIEFD